MGVTPCGKQADNSARGVGGSATADITSCAACAANTWAATDGDNCVAKTACAGTTDGGTTARVEVTAATATADATCTPCASGFFAAGNGNCVAHTTTAALNCGDQLATDTHCAIKRATVPGTWGVNGAADCAANTVCGKQVGGTAGDRAVG